MKKDPIVEEIRRIREAHAAKYNYDLKAICADLKKKGKDLDALLFTAEAGSAWTLLYPDYMVVVPHPDIIAVPLAYPLAYGNQEMADYMNIWIELKKKDKTIENLYNYWILGQGATKKEPRWSVIRNVLHWVD